MTDQEKRLQLYEDAKAALMKNPRDVSDDDRVVVGKFIADVLATDTRLQFFEYFVATRAIVHKDKVADRILERLPMFGDAIIAFRDGGSIPKELREDDLIGAYMDLWIGQLKNEQLMHSIIDRVLASPEAAQLRESMKRD